MFGAWALSFGCAVGWGAFVMPGTTFIPKAGPLGTLIGLFAGTVVMLVIASNYAALMEKYRSNGGTLTFSAKEFGYDHGFIASWFLILVYMAIIWANAAALPMMARFFAPGVFKFGFHYQIACYDVYFGELLLSFCALTLAAALCVFGRRAAVFVQSILAALLMAGILFCFVKILFSSPEPAFFVYPCFSPEGEAVPLQILGVMLFAPWAFVGFESISHSVEKTAFSKKQFKAILFLALAAAFLAYGILSWISVQSVPGEFGSWPEYFKKVSASNGITGFPVFASITARLGKSGFVVAGISALCAVLTGLIGHFVAAGRLLRAMADDGILPRRFSQMNKKDNPANSLFFILAVSYAVPFFGSSAINWIVVVNTIGASIAYGYTSAAALKLAKRERNGAAMAAAFAGLLFSLFFLLYYFFNSFEEIPVETYVVLALWCLLGIEFFKYVFKNDKRRRFGRSTSVWLCLMLFAILISFEWERRADRDIETRVFAASGNSPLEEIEAMTSAHTKTNVAQILFELAVMLSVFSLYKTIMDRERKFEREKIRAEESSQAKSHFLFNMSHDVRTPMNAIIGYTHILKKMQNLDQESLSYVKKIDESNKQLLSIIDDVLEMSQIESGNLAFANAEDDLGRVVKEVFDSFEETMDGKNISYKLDTALIENTVVIFDKRHLSQILSNLISNAAKFTRQGGRVLVSVTQSAIGSDEKCEFVITVRDNGIGMSADFAENVFNPFERERSSTDSGLSGTGLGLAITKRVVDAMGGTISVQTEQGKGSEFTVRLKFPVRRKKDGSIKDSQEQEQDFYGKRVLLAEDMEVNRDIARMILEDAGFVVETAINGKEALDLALGSEKNYFDLVITDIQMPVMDGFEFAKALRSSERADISSLPILAMTANTTQNDMQNADKAGMDGFISKPIDVEKMFEAIRASRKTRL